MRITIVAGPFLPLPPAFCGAIEKVWQGLALEFSKRRHRVTVLCRGHPSQNPDEKLQGISYVRRTSFSKTGLICVDLVKDMAYSLRVLLELPRADITVTNVFWLPVFASLRRRRVGKLVVNLGRFPKGQLPLYTKADQLVAASSAVFEAIAEQCPPATSKTRVIPYPVNTMVFRPPDRPRQTSAELVILYAGRVHPEKGVHLLVDAFARLYRQNKRLRLRVVGPVAVEEGGGGNKYLHCLMEKAAALPVVFEKGISEEAVLARVLQHAHCFCYPSLADKGESFGVAPLEAMATGLVPIVSNLACFRDFVEEGLTGYVFDHNSHAPAEALANVLRKVISDPDKTAAMGERAAKKAREFSYPRVADMYLDDFATLLKSGTRRE